MTAAAGPLAAHIEEMAARCSAIYGLFPRVDAAALSAPVQAGVARELGALADFAVWQELAIEPAAVAAALETVLAEAVLPAGEFAAAWRCAVEASLPARRSAALVLHRFVPWVAQLPQACRTLLTGDLQVLFAHAADLGEDGIQAILADVVGSGGGEEPAVAAATIKAYAETDAAHLRAVAYLSALALRGARRDLIAAMTQVVTLDRMQEEQDAGRLLPATETACRQAEQTASGSGLAVLETVVLLAARKISSAYAVARRIQRILKRMPAATAAAYLHGAKRLIMAAGPRLVGFAVDRLPGMYAKDPDRAQALVEAAVALAERGGTCAVEWLVQGRTAAARTAFNM